MLGSSWVPFKIGLKTVFVASFPEHAGQLLRVHCQSSGEAFVDSCVDLLISTTQQVLVSYSKTY